MPPCHSENHPQVPVTVAGVFVTYCHQCQCFTVSWWRTTQYDDSDDLQGIYNQVELGPFDGVAQVIPLLERAYLECLSGSGLPWDHSSW